MRTVLVFCVYLAAMGASARDLPDDAAKLARANNDFAVALYRRAAPRAEGNFLFSPSSLHTALTMTCAGARGRTADEMARALRLPSGPVHAGYGRLLGRLKPTGPRAGYQLHVANALWGEKGAPWRDEFLTVTRKHYGAGLREVDFAAAPAAARKTINTWAAKQTRDKIKELLGHGALDATTHLVLANAIYFKGEWAAKFEKLRTRRMPFHQARGRAVPAAMMYQKRKFGYAVDRTLRVLSLPYKGEELSMVILLPRKLERPADVAKRLTAKDLSAWISRLRPEPLQVYLPRFTVTSQFDAKKALTDLGMGVAFSSKADFSGMSERSDLFISAVIHKAFAAVDEEGTEAAAATAVLVKKNGDHTTVFRADRPFVFLIRHNATGAILFMGHVSTPDAPTPKK